jgi:DNA-binding MarR family transcriptional regulator
MNEAMLLCLLSENKSLSAGDISTELGLTCSNASKVIASMEKSGLILRRTSKADGRSMTFSLSKKGTALLDKVHCDNIQIPEDLQRLISKDFKTLD